jgi:hypothetical protein
MHHFKNKTMITHEKLIKLGYYYEEINDNKYYIKGWIRLERIFCGYLLKQPYKVISTIDELKQIEND